MLMGSFVTLYNYIGFKLTGAPYNLSTALVGWIFIVYLVGTFSSTWFGSLSMKHGRQKVMYAGIYIMITGAVLTLPSILAVKILGIVIFTFGFFGAFIELESGIDALLHVSQIAREHIEKPSAVLSVGQEVEAKIVDVNLEDKKISLSMKALLPELPEEEAATEE